MMGRGGAPTVLGWNRPRDWRAQTIACSSHGPFEPDQPGRVRAQVRDKKLLDMPGVLCTVWIDWTFTRD